jgi:hypothetical protein
MRIVLASQMRAPVSNPVITPANRCPREPDRGERAGLRECLRPRAGRGHDHIAYTGEAPPEVNGDDAFIFHSNSANPAATVRNIRPMALAVLDSATQVMLRPS